MAQYKLNDKGEWIKFTVKNLHIHEQTKIMRKKGNNIDERNVRENRWSDKGKNKWKETRNSFGGNMSNIIRFCLSNGW